MPLSKELAQTQGLKIGCLNIRGLLSKIDELKIILDECNVDITGVCETCIDSNVADNEISIDGYSIVKKKIETDTVEGCYCMLKPTFMQYPAIHTNYSL